ncbi:TetR/AcrR family transcriptional regulator [Aeromicrobium panaciterrae]|uniref:TetR/AcrR family transcriptional regulator n=1 Tax=Aeromicrobium panaciterrae TaxID=363861 RepID=UPI0031E26E8C
MTVDAKPRGREQIRTAVLTATSALVAERGPDGFSVRDIAARAGVNHALVHRHFGTKADVLEQMLAADADVVVRAVVEAGLPTEGSASPEVVAELLDLLAATPSYWRTLVHAVLDSPEAALPGTASTTELFSGLWRDSGPADAVQTSVAGASVLGWLIFGQFMSDATGADPEDVRRAIAEQVSALLSS